MTNCGYCLGPIKGRVYSYLRTPRFPLDEAITFGEFVEYTRNNRVPVCKDCLKEMGVTVHE